MLTVAVSRSSSDNGENVEYVNNVMFLHNRANEAESKTTLCRVRRVAALGVKSDVYDDLVSALSL